MEQMVTPGSGPAQESEKKIQEKPKATPFGKRWPNGKGITFDQFIADEDFVV